MAQQKYNESYDIILHNYEVETLVRLLGSHIAGPDNGPRGILVGILKKLEAAANISMDDFPSLHIPHINFNRYNEAVLYISYDYNDPKEK